MVAHPPCTYLASSGMHWTIRGKRDPQLTEDALAFVAALTDAPIERIAIENPIGAISSRIRKPDQIVQPFWFGDDASKKTCWWLKGLPKLVPTKMLEPSSLVCSCGISFPSACGAQGCPDCEENTTIKKGIYANQTASGQNKLAPSDDRWKERSRTYQGIADAIASQWFLE